MEKNIHKTPSSNSETKSKNTKEELRHDNAWRKQKRKEEHESKERKTRLRRKKSGFQLFFFVKRI